MLYTGLRPPTTLDSGSLHVPFIRVEPILCPHAQSLMKPFAQYTHLLFTSQSAVHFFVEQVGAIHKPLPLIYSIGKATKRCLEAYGMQVSHVAEEETAEGVVELLRETMPTCGHLFYPHSAQARPVLGEYLASAPFRSTVIAIYQTIKVRPDPLPDLAFIKSVLFTSPSTVEAFLACYGQIPSHVTCFAIGPVTADALGKFGYASLAWTSAAEAAFA